MKKCVNGEYIEMTAEEIDAMRAEEVVAEPTIEERLAAIEALLAERRGA